MAHRKIHIASGDRFGSLTATADEIKSARGARLIVCVCDCGAMKGAAPSDLFSGRVKSCGCQKRLRAQKMGKSNVRHGHTLGHVRSPTYLSWQNMMQRCYDQKTNGFHNYGGRGIVVCIEWHSFDRFFADMGTRPDGKTIERLDVNGDYGPDNCIWATLSHQSANRRNSKRITFNGETKTAADWGRTFGTHRNNILRRHKKGSPIDGS